MGIAFSLVHKWSSDLEGSKSSRDLILDDLGWL